MPTLSVLEFGRPARQWHKFPYPVRWRRRSHLIFPFPQAVATPLVVQKTTQIGTGILPVYSPATPSGDSYINTFGAVVNILNAGSTTILVTIIARQICNQGYLHNYTMSVPPNTVPSEIGPVDFHYQVSGTNAVSIAYSNTVGVTVAVTAP